jgi:AraC-like DNA-binding protein/PAS domain-containing protein
METKDIERLRQIKKAVFSIAQGDFNYRIARTNLDDVIERISVIVNMITEEMKETLRLYSDLHFHQSKQNPLHLIFILDNDLRILNVTPDVYEALGYKKEDMLHLPFPELLSKNSLEVWQAIASNFLYSPDYSTKQQLLLRCKNKSERSYNCGITSVYDEGKGARNFIISIYDPMLKSKVFEDGGSIRKMALKKMGKEAKAQPTVLLNSADRKTLNAIYSHILQNLGQPLPHLEQIAHTYGINEYKLKYGFKELYGTSVFRFLKQERLKKARLLIENTNTPINVIANICGYQNKAHFSKEFRNFFDLTPRMVRKQR